MNEVSKIKRFVLRALVAANGMPLPSGNLEDACRAVLPGMLVSDFNQALRGLEEDGFVAGVKDELDGSVSWGLTAKGELKSRQL